jgi:N-acetylglucosaminyldiphosphoundecaprenol N-acetyl-beta-D-mannosaminyltransferase
MTSLPTVDLLGLAFDSVTLPVAAEAIVTAALERTKGLVVTPNVDHILLVHDDAKVAGVYRRAMFRFADGMPIVWLSRMTRRGRALPERVTGADLLVATCERAAASGATVFFAGGKPGVAETAGARLRERFPGLAIVGTDAPPLGFERDPVLSKKLAEKITAARPHLLFMGVGTPKQELWADAHLSALDCGPILCCGAAFDCAAGTAKRAPVAVQRFGVEWLWRLLHEPRRLWRRYLVRGPRFFGFALRELRRPST